MTEDEAQKIAERRMREVSGSFQFKLATHSNCPLKFPIGWRFPYDLFYDGDRVANSRVVLFVNKENGELETEQCDIPSFENLEHPDCLLPELSNIQDNLKTDYPGMQVETHEKIWVVTKNTRQRAWRLGLTTARRYRYSTWIGNDPKGNINYIKKPELKSKVIPNQLLQAEDIPLPLSSDKNFLKRQRSTQNWITHTIEYLMHLGYNRINHNEIDINLFRASCNNDCAYFSRRNNTAEITFMDFRWADDPTIVYHELGHAIWYLFFTPEADPAIGEGFADYFAATLFAADKTFNQVEIGGGLPKTIKQIFKQRLITGNPFNFTSDSNSPEHKYKIGHKWANLLWDLRQQIGPEKADAIIFLAHFKPFTGECQPQDPMEAYFQSLKQAAERLKDAKLLEIDFTEWHQLEVRHQI